MDYAEEYFISGEEAKPFVISRNESHIFVECAFFEHRFDIIEQFERTTRLRVEAIVAQQLPGIKWIASQMFAGGLYDIIADTETCACFLVGVLRDDLIYKAEFEEVQDPKQLPSALKLLAGWTVLIPERR